MSVKKWNWTVIWALFILWHLYSSCRELFELHPVGIFCDWRRDTFMTHWQSSDFVNSPQKDNRMTSLMISRTLFKRHLSKTNRSTFSSLKNSTRSLAVPWSLTSCWKHLQPLLECLQHAPCAAQCLSTGPPPICWRPSCAGMPQTGHRTPDVASPVPITGKSSLPSTLDLLATFLLMQPSMWLAFLTTTAGLGSAHSPPGCPASSSSKAAPAQVSAQPVLLPGLMPSQCQGFALFNARLYKSPVNPFLQLFRAHLDARPTLTVSAFPTICCRQLQTCWDSQNKLTWC